jgi:hypothetical protein
MRWLPPVMTAFDLIPDLASKVSYGQTLPVRDNRLKVCCVGLSGRPGSRNFRYVWRRAA